MAILSAPSIEAKSIIDNFMKGGIERNEIVMLHLVLGLLKAFNQETDRQTVINYVEANYPSGYLLIDSEPLFKQIAEATKDKDILTACHINKLMITKK